MSKQEKRNKRKVEHTPPSVNSDGNRGGPANKKAAFEGMNPQCKAEFHFHASGVDISKFNASRENLHTYVGANFGRLEGIIRHLEYFNWDRVAPRGPDEPYTDANDANQVLRRTLQGRVDAHVKEQAQYEQNKVRLFHLIWGQCTEAMKHKLRSAGIDTYDPSDPLSLWKKIVTFSLHQGLDDVTHASSALHEAQCRARMNYISAMKVDEDIGDFYKRFCEVYEALQANGFHLVANPALPAEVTDQAVRDRYLQDLEEKEESLLAQLFLSKLNKARYSVMLDELETKLTIYHEDHYPKTLLEAYDMATNRKDGAYRPEVHRTNGFSSRFSEQNRVAFVTGGRERQQSQQKARKDGNLKGQSKESNPTSGKTTGGGKSGTCHICKEHGHYQNQCPILKEALKLKEAKDASKMALTTLVRHDSEEDYDYTINNPGFALATSSRAAGMFLKGDILCDSESSVNIFRDPELLENIRPAETNIRVSGIGGGIDVSLVGDLAGFGEVYYHPKAIANILSLYDVARNHGIHYDRRKNTFTTNIYGRDWEFKPKNKMYIFNLLESIRKEENALVIETVEANKAGFRKSEIAAADEARLLWKKLAYPPVKVFIQMLNNGNILKSPVTVHDVKRMIQIYGIDPAVVKGRVTRTKAAKVIVEKVERQISGTITLAADIMFVDGVAFLITISRRLQLITVSWLASKRESDLKSAFEAIIGEYKLRTFSVNTVLSDGERGIASLANFFALQLGIQYNPAGKNDHVPEVERAIRLVKERVRIIWNGLPYQICNEILIHLVNYCVFMINLCPKTTSTSSVLSPKEMFTGRKLDVEKECKIEFGAYVQVHEDNLVINGMTPRSTGAIALGSAGTIQATYKFLSLTTWKVLHRKSWTALPMPNEVLKILNERALAHRTTTYIKSLPRFFRQHHEVIETVTPEEVPQILDDTIIPPVDPEPDGDEEGSQMDIEDVQNSGVQETSIYPDDSGDPSHPQTEDNSDQEVDEVDVAQRNDEDDDAQQRNDMDKDDDAQNEETDNTAEFLDRVYNLRPRKKTWRERAQEMALTTYTVKGGIEHLGAEALLSIMEELSQLHLKTVFRPMTVGDIPSHERARTLRTIMFLKKKRDGRLKSRLVADGSQQQRQESVFDVSSPTVATESVFMILAIAGAQRRHATTTDVEGAYLHCEMVGRVIVRLDRRLSAIMVNLFPEIYSGFLDEKGELHLLLLKALYGCIESARLFFNHVSGTLRNFGFEENPYDTCVMNKTLHGKQCSVCIHVDDILITCEDPRGVEDTIKELRRVYTNVNACSGPKINYLGMDLEFDQDKAQAVVSMTRIVQEIVEYWNTKCSEESPRTCKTPASQQLFEVSPDSEPLGKEKREVFHSVVAKLLYLAKRGRPDVLLAVNFLTTRVINSTQEDWRKLDRIVSYLRGTPEVVMLLGGQVGRESVKVDAYADASHAVHPDQKGHSGVVITLGRGAVFCKSSKQKLVSRSSTEAELVGLSDGLTQILWSRLFLQSQGFQVPPVTVHQDNKSAILLEEKGRSNAGRTRHINIRYYFVKDKIESGEVTVVYTPTEKMVADFFTKPLQGSLYLRLRSIIMGHGTEGAGEV